MLWKLARKLAVLVLGWPSDPGSTFKCLAIYNFLGSRTAGFVSEADEISMISSSRSSSHTIPEATWFEMRCLIRCAHSISEGHSEFPVGLDVWTSCRYVSLSGMNEKKMRTYTFETFLKGIG